MPTNEDCPICTVSPGEYHAPNCLAEACPYCGEQLAGCEHWCEPIPLDDRMAWTGEWPGTSECQEFGWFAKLGSGGWVRCDRDDPEAEPDYNRLRKWARWDRQDKRYVRRQFDHAAFRIEDDLTVTMQVFDTEGFCLEPKVGKATYSFDELFIIVRVALIDLRSEGWLVTEAQSEAAEDRIGHFWDKLNLIDFSDDIEEEGNVRDEIEFWRLIDAAKQDSGSDLDRQVECLTEKLSEMSVESILAFDRTLSRYLKDARSDELWTVAAAIHGGYCSDDGFDYCLGWLIAQGEETFRLALSEPESLIGLVEPVAWCEPILYVAKEAYALKTGIDVDEVWEQWPDVAVAEN